MASVITHEHQSSSAVRTILTTVFKAISFRLSCYESIIRSKPCSPLPWTQRGTHLGPFLPHVSNRPFLFFDNFGISGPIFITFSLLSSERICRGSLNKTTTHRQICCRSTLRKVNVQLNSFTFIIARIMRFMSGDICFVNFYFLICFFYFLTVTSL